MTGDMSNYISSTKRFFWRYHLTIFAVVAVAGVSIAIIILLGVITQSSNPVTTAPESESFDQDTIERVKQLNDTPDYNFNLPSNQRINPFAE